MGIATAVAMNVYMPRMICKLESYILFTRNGLEVDLEGFRTLPPRFNKLQRMVEPMPRECVEEAYWEWSKAETYTEGAEPHAGSWWWSVRTMVGRT